MKSLLNLCVQHISTKNIDHLNEKLNQICYDKVMDYRIEQGFIKWNKLMDILKIDLNIDEMDVSYDMYLDSSCYFIYIKFKNNELEDEGLDDGEVYRDEYDTPLYHLYYEIAKRRGLID